MRLLRALQNDDICDFKNVLTTRSNMIDDIEKECVLHLACEDGKTQMVYDLLHCGMSVNHGKPSPLMRACRRGHIDIVTLLLLHGADVNAIDKNLMTPLMYACQNENIDIVDLLLFHGARIDMENCNGHRALHLACQSTSVKYRKLIVLQLLDDGDPLSDLFERVEMERCNPDILEMLRLMENTSRLVAKRVKNSQYSICFDAIPLSRMVSIPREACNGKRSTTKVLGLDSKEKKGKDIPR